MRIDGAEIAARFGRAVRRRRLAIGLTQRQLAEIVEPPIPREVVSRAEQARGCVGFRYVPTVGTLIRFACALECSPAVLARDVFVESAVWPWRGWPCARCRPVGKPGYRRVAGGHERPEESQLSSGSAARL